MIRRPALILALLTALNFLNYLDRLVLSAVLPKVQDELGLSYGEGGALATVFLVGYFATSPLFGAAADRHARKGLIALGIFVWSAATVASGLARGLPSLVAARALVGVGEAAYATLAPTIIDDLAPPDKKGRWLAVFYVAAPVGSAMGYLVGGAVEHAHGWRAAFYVAGGPGVLLALACLLIAEPARKLATTRPGVVADARRLLRLPQYRRGVLGYCATSFVLGGFAYWAPTFLFRTYGLTLARANFLIGIITVVSGIVGTAAGGFWADAKSKRAMAGGGGGDGDGDGDRDATTVVANMQVCFWGAVLGAPVALVCFLAPTAPVFFVAIFVCELGIFLTMSPINAVILRSVPEELRASAMALSILLIHALGDLWSPPLVGVLADHFPMRYAMMVLPLAFAASIFFWAPRKAPAARASSSAAA